MRAQARHPVFALTGKVGLALSQWEPCVLEGKASLRTVENEQSHGCDLVVRGKHGQSATADLLLGSATKHVLAEGNADLRVLTGGGPCVPQPPISDVAAVAPAGHRRPGAGGTARREPARSS